ncbi:hypothetical protein HUJ04_011162 [Dendroctonus ponderosae]|nr:hypothetical protein HUJ04_011162 [Dendroctonus ponderosae]KAH1028407.1 hypothetical protein HUJ05_001761 [Dendroctonus ponderosae]
MNEQIVIKNCEKSYTFDYILKAESPEEELHNRCFAPLMKNICLGIHIPNATKVMLHSVEDVLSILAKSSLGRATASTNMN